MWPVRYISKCAESHQRERNYGKWHKIMIRYYLPALPVFIKYAMRFYKTGNTLLYAIRTTDSFDQRRAIVEVNNNITVVNAKKTLYLITKYIIVKSKSKYQHTGCYHCGTYCKYQYVDILCTLNIASYTSNINISRTYSSMITSCHSGRGIGSLINVISMP